MSRQTSVRPPFAGDQLSVTSELHIEANRRNARLDPGPRTQPAAPRRCRHHDARGRGSRPYSRPACRKNSETRLGRPKIKTSAYDPEAEPKATGLQRHRDGQPPQGYRCAHNSEMRSNRVVAFHTFCAIIRRRPVTFRGGYQAAPNPEAACGKRCEANESESRRRNWSRSPPDA